MKRRLRILWDTFTNFYTLFVMLATTLGIAPVLIQMVYYLFANHIEKAVAMAIVYYILINTNLKLGGNVSGQ